MLKKLEEIKTNKVIFIYVFNQKNQELILDTFCPITKAVYSDLINRSIYNLLDILEYNKK